MDTLFQITKLTVIIKRNYFSFGLKPTGKHRCLPRLTRTWKLACVVQGAVEFALGNGTESRKDVCQVASTWYVLCKNSTYRNWLPVVESARRKKKSIIGIQNDRV